ncbi:cell wall hydrolase [Pseudoflavonifractor sp. 60]|uniref:cell wall hydrolase n=1 Tax=Pseudoflavonifractor sp. 60 TaxID=2304576 RepID=UPI001369FDC5|nr:cell wall hydrolase [Pseudoflavonifractor sp. 60]MCI8914816.1 cell wall hydrolase [Lawsonibacter sp.]NBI65229.1 cell wall hydrolase [Pseudoflavonifractor sp. 60]
MKRKLFSIVLSAFALLLLMGAAADPQPAAALLAEEESAVSNETALETEAQTTQTPTESPDIPAGEETPAEEDASANTEDPAGEGMPADTEASAEDSAPAVDEVPTGDTKLLIDGQPAPLELGKYYQKGTTYVSVALMAQLLDPAAQIAWDGETMTVTTQQLTLTAQAGKLYVVANGRYLYVPEEVQLPENGQLSAPLSALTRAFGAGLVYDVNTGAVSVTRGVEAIASGDSFYDAEDLYWLSRIIYRESGNQSLEGQMAVGNVVLNRVASSIFPDTVESVLAQKNQFSCYKSGALAKTDPSQTSVIAAKLVMDGGEVEETKGALFFDSGSNSWAARNKKLIATLGGHKFYG